MGGTFELEVVQVVALVDVAAGGDGRVDHAGGDLRHPDRHEGDETDHGVVGVEDEHGPGGDRRQAFPALLAALGLGSSLTNGAQPRPSRGVGSAARATTRGAWACVAAGGLVVVAGVGGCGVGDALPVRGPPHLGGRGGASLRHLTQQAAAQCARGLLVGQRLNGSESGEVFLDVVAGSRRELEGDGEAGPVPAGDQPRVQGQADVAPPLRGPLRRDPFAGAVGGRLRLRVRRRCRGQPRKFSRG